MCAWFDDGDDLVVAHCLAQPLQRGADGGGVVREIVIDADALILVDQFHPAFHTAERTQGFGGNTWRNTRMTGGGDCCQGVVDVVLPELRPLHLTHRDIVDADREPAAVLRHVPGVHDFAGVSFDTVFDTALAESAGASFVARTTVYHVMEMQKIIARALAKKGFSAVEVVSNCHTYYGKMTGMKTAVDMMHWMRDSTAPVTLAEERRAGKMPRGVLVDRERPEYGEAYQGLLARARDDKARLLAAGMPVP